MRSSIISAPALTAAAISRAAFFLSETKMAAQRKVMGGCSLPADSKLAHQIGNLLLGRFARLPQRQSHLAAVAAGDFHRPLDAHRIPIEKHRSHQREKAMMDGGGVL